MVFTVNGTDATSMVSIAGLAWTKSDIHSDDSGRDLDGTMHITVIGRKVTLSISAVALNEENARNLLTVIESAPPLKVTYDDPQKGETRTADFYVGDRNCEFLMQLRGRKWWQNIKFDLVEC